MATIFNVPDEARPEPICDLKDLIAERTEVSGNTPAPIFKMNPKVDDIPEKYSVQVNGIKLMTLGAIRKGGAGCACAENAFLKQLLSYMTVLRNETVIIDMEAGIEHLGRGTVQGVDTMIVVVEPNRTSIETALRIQKLAADIKVKSLKVVGNKVGNAEEEEFIREKCGSLEVLGFLPFSDDLLKLSRGELSLFDIDSGIPDLVRGIVLKLKVGMGV
ncbi:MAG: hypothetical protein JW969_11180, partial [Spirochaetales bacterium]|nr:hypothetical protein [Spirochaetales bacterium]